MATAKHPGGRKRIRIDPKRVEQFAVMGCSSEEIAAELGVEAQTIKRRFNHILKTGHKRLHLRLRSKLVQEAMKGNTAIAIFLGKTMLGLKEPITEQHMINIAAIAQGGQVKIVTDDVKKKFAEIDRAVQLEIAQLDRVGTGNGNGNNNS
jgi:hypothetical protein